MKTKSPLYLPLSLLAVMIFLVVLNSVKIAASEPEAGGQGGAIAVNMAAISQLGGEPADVALQGEYLFAAFGTSLIIFDVSQPSSPAATGQIVLSREVRSVAVDGDYAYLAACEYDDCQLQVVDITVPENPKPLGFLSATWEYELISIAARYGFVYLTAGNDGLRVVDASDPNHPVEVGFSPGRAVDVFVSGNLAFVATGPDAILQIIDISTPAAPVELSTVAMPGEHASLVSIVGDLAVLTQSSYPTDLLWTIDVSNPAAPTVLGQYSTDWVKALAVSGDYAFLPIWSSPPHIEIIDISEPANPVLFNTVTTEGNPVALALDSNTLYLAALWSGLQVFNIADLSAPIQIAFVRLPERAEDVALVGDMAYIADWIYGFKVIDVSEPTHPQIVATYGAEDSPLFTHIAVDGPVAAVFDERIDGLRLIDISDPTTPAEVGVHQLPPGQIHALTATSGMAYVADGIYGLRLIDISDPANPMEVGFYPVPDTSVDDVAVIGDNAYLAADGLRVVDVSNPGQPVEIGYLQAAGSAIAVDANRACLAGEALALIDISNPTAPTFIGSIEMPHPVLDVAMADGLCYATIDYYGGGVRVVDASVPAVPRELGFYHPPNYSGGTRVTVADGLAFMAAGDLGLYILHYYPPESYLPLVSR